MSSVEVIRIVHQRTSIGDQNLGILERLVPTGADFLVQDEALIKVRVGQLASWFLDDLDVV